MVIHIAVACLAFQHILCNDEMQCSRLNSYKLSMISGYKLVGHDVQTVPNVSRFLDCVKFCSHYPTCRSFNYDSLSEECSLKSTLPKCFPDDLQKSVNGTISFYEVKGKCRNKLRCVGKWMMLPITNNYCWHCHSGWKIFPTVWLSLNINSTYAHTPGLIRI